MDAPGADKASNVSGETRLQQIRALRLRAKDSKKQNRQEIFAENARLKDDPAAAKKLSLKRNQAVEKLARLDATEAGQDFERKRAWDYSIADSQAWDVRIERIKTNKRQAGFSDYASDAVKQYERDTQAFLKQDSSASQLQQTRNDAEAEVVLVDPSDLGFLDNKPDKAHVDALVSGLAARDAQRDKINSRRRAKEGDPGSYINDRNRKFNQKTARAYDQYTKEMRDSFERGTAQ